MRLSLLEPEFVRLKEGSGGGFQIVPTVAEAQGLWFVCPLCFRNRGETTRGCHHILCWSRSAGVPDEITPGPGRWRLVGTGLQDVTLECEQGQSRSILLTSGCQWHGYITNGEAHE